MFDKQIIDTDKFCDMPITAKALYFLLGMEADDRGFVSPRRIMRLHGGTEDDLKILIAKRYVLYFESGVVVITDWNKNNYLDKNRLKETEFIDELRTLELVDQKYQFSTGFSQPLIGQLPISVENYSQSSDLLLNKCLTSIEENSIEEYRTEQKAAKKNVRFSPPNVDDVSSYCKERNNLVDPQSFVDFYSSKGWLVGNAKMKDWKAAVRTWEQRSGFKAPEEAQGTPCKYEDWMPIEWISITDQQRGNLVEKRKKLQKPLDNLYITC